MTSYGNSACFFFYVGFYLIWLVVIEERTDQLRITLRRSFKSTIFPTIDLGRNSMSHFPHQLINYWTVFVDSKKRSRKFGRCNVCAAIGVSPSARPRMRGDRIKPSWSEHTTHQNRMHGRQGIRHSLLLDMHMYYYTHLMDNMDRRAWRNRKQE